jgi:DNA-binding response OmpR family regulator
MQTSTINRIIVVEDDPSILDTLQLILGRDDVAIEMHANGNTILDDNFEVPSLFILDKQLPGVDGLELCKLIKSRRRTSCVPVIMLSASPSIFNLAKKAGADDSIEKPFKMVTLRETVNKYLT